MWRSIQAKFLGFTIPALILLSIVALSGHGYLNYLRAGDELRMRLDQFVASSTIILAEPIARGLNDQVSLILASMIADADVETVAISDKAGKVIDSFGKIEPADRIYERKASITFADEQGVRVVGYLEIQASDRRLMRDLWHNLYFEATMGAVLILIAILVTIFGYRRAVAAPLELLRRAFVNARPETDRRIDEWRSEDEIGALFRAYNGMQEKLQANEDALRTMQRELEMRVQDRTRALLIAKEEAEGANRAKSNFLSVISHELRTPLTSIKGGLGLLERNASDALSQEARTIFEIAARNCGRLESLIDDLLDIQKIEAGAIDFRVETLSAASLIANAVAENQGLGEVYQSRFVVTPFDPGMTAIGDEGRVMQVFANLLSNAAKFSPPGAEVEVGVSECGASLRFSVRDYGPGIGDDFKDSVFERFSQQDAENDRQVGGAGLGLHIAKMIVEQLGGTIGFTNAKDAGTVFYFELPAGDRLRQTDRMASG